MTIWYPKKKVEQVYTHNMYEFAPWASHNTFFRSVEFKTAAESVKWSIVSHVIDSHVYILTSFIGN